MKRSVTYSHVEFLYLHLSTQVNLLIKLKMIFQFNKIIVPKLMCDS